MVESLHHRFELVDGETAVACRPPDGEQFFKAFVDCRVVDAATTRITFGHCEKNCGFIADFELFVFRKRTECLRIIAEIFFKFLRDFFRFYGLFFLGSCDFYRLLDSLFDFSHLLINFIFLFHVNSVFKFRCCKIISLLKLFTLKYYNANKNICIAKYNFLNLPCPWKGGFHRRLINLL